MNQRLWRYIQLIFFTGGLFFASGGFAQCPPNIGFENGNFDYWECSIGFISMLDGTITVSPSGPVDNRHTLLTNTYPQARDPYGNFPVNCPNGSGYSIRLGNSQTGREAERVSYTFTIPANDDNYSIIYNYAVVFQNPSHAVWEQPKFTANVYDVGNNAYIGCSSFSYAASSNLPGFKQAPGRDSSIFYKEWTPVTIKLSGYAGRTIRLEFTTNDCTRGGHFGYAYVDVNENCSSPISGSVSCLHDSAQTLIAPYGFASYRWFNTNFSQLLGSSQQLSFAPPPPDKTVFAVEITPFPGQGCTDTVYATIQYASDIIDLEVPATPLEACQSTGIDLTSASIVSGSSPGLVLAYYLDPNQTNYIPTPKFISTSGTYYIKATNSVGCIAIKPVMVNIYSTPDFTMSAQTKALTRPNTFDLSTLVAGNTNGLVYTYWKDAAATIPLTDPGAIGAAGTYYIKGSNVGGCSVIKSVTVTLSEPTIVAPNAFSPNGDGINDVWNIPLLSLYNNCSVEIYNRLGQLIYKSTGTYTPWNGKYNGIDQPVDTYYYIIKPDPTLPPVGGSVTIVR